MIRSFLLFVTLFAATASMAKPDVDALTKVYGERSPSLKEFLTIVENPNVTKIADVLESLPIEYRTSFTLMYDSRSLQEASPENPRAIVFGPDAKLILTFNGAPEQHGYEKLEVMAFDELQKRYRFIEVEFPAESKKKYDQQQPIVRMDPSKCTKCHSEFNKPIWDSYSHWRGAYGEFDDFIGARFGPIDQAVLASYFQKKKDAFMKHERYSKLGWLDRINLGGYQNVNESVRGKLSELKPLLPNFPYDSPGRGRLSPKTEPNVYTQSTVNYLGVLRPNLRLQHFLNANYARALAHQISAVNSETKKLDLRWLKTDEAPQEKTSRLVFSALWKFRNSTLKKNVFGYRAQHWKTICQNDCNLSKDAIYFDFYYKDEFFNLRSLSAMMAAHHLGIRLTEFNLNLEKNLLTDSVSNFTFPWLLSYRIDSRPMASRKFTEDFWLVPGNAPKDDKDVYIDQQGLLKFGRKPETSGADLVQECAHCHTGVDRVAPQIPFDKPFELGRALSERLKDGRSLFTNIEDRLNRVDLRRMPSNRIWSQNEIDTLVSYLRGLQSETNFDKEALQIDGLGDW